MTRFLRSRLLDLVIGVLGVSTAVFFLLRLTGDPVALLVTETATREEMERIREAMGLNAPLWEQYVSFLARALRGDFGESIRLAKPAAALVWDTLPATLELTTAALGIATLLALPLDDEDPGLEALFPVKGKGGRK